MHEQLIKFALPKGRYISHSSHILYYFGLSVKPFLCYYYCPEQNIEFYLVRARDTARLCSEGLFDIALCPDEWIIDDRLRRRSIAPSSAAADPPIPYWSDNSRISLLAPPQLATLHQVRSVVTTYTSIARDYLSNKNIKADITFVSGSAEAFIGTISQCGIDCVQTGKTASAHGLIEKDVIYRNLGLSFLIFDQTRIPADLIPQLPKPPDTFNG